MASPYKGGLIKGRSRVLKALNPSIVENIHAEVGQKNVRP